MDDKRAAEMQLQIASVKKNLKTKRRNVFLILWLGYSVITFWILNLFDKCTDLTDFIEMALGSTVLGLIFWLINAAVWSNCCKSIFDTDQYLKKMEKDYAELLSQEHNKN